MHILFLNAYFEPESIAFTHLERDLINSLLSVDCEISVICPVPTRGVSADVAKRYKKIKREELYDGKLHVRRFWAPQEVKNPIVRMFRYIWCNLRTYRIARKYKNVDVIFANSTPPTQGALCARVKKKLERKYKREVPFVFDLQDIFPDSLVNAKMTKKGSLIWKIGRKIENFTYRHADKIIVISEDFKRNIMEKGVPEEKIVIIPNWVNTENVYSVERKDNILFDRYGLSRDKFYICYSGNLGHSQNLRLLLDAAKSLKDELPDLHFVLIGEGAAKEELVNAIATEGIDNLTVLPFQPYEEISHVFSLGDIGLIISKSGIGESSVPSKTFSIMAAERPVLASFDQNSALCHLIEKVGCGICAEAGSLDALTAAIRTLYTERESNATLGARGRAYLHDELDKDKCVGMYIQTIKNQIKGE